MKMSQLFSDYKIIYEDGKSSICKCTYCGKDGVVTYVKGGWHQWPANWLVAESMERVEVVCSRQCALDLNYVQNRAQNERNK